MHTTGLPQTRAKLVYKFKTPPSIRKKIRFDDEQEKQIMFTKKRDQIASILPCTSLDGLTTWYRQFASQKRQENQWNVTCIKVIAHVLVKLGVLRYGGTKIRGLMGNKKIFFKIHLTVHI